MDSVRTDLRSLPYTDSDTGVVVQCPTHMKKKLTKEQRMHEGCWDWGRYAAIASKEAGGSFFALVTFFLLHFISSTPSGSRLHYCLQNGNYFHDTQHPTHMSTKLGAQVKDGRRNPNCQREILDLRCSVDSLPHCVHCHELQTSRPVV